MELEFLKQLASHDELLGGLLKVWEAVPGRNVSFRLSRAEAEIVRDHLTTHLAAVGFDQDYSPNQQGQLDRFYRP